MFSPLGCWTQVDPRETRTALRHSFQRWGRPERLRVDNGAPWGTRGDLPTDLVCWLAGLDVEVKANPPRSPQDNGVVERMQGVGKQWCEPWTCGSSVELEKRLEVMDRVQRERYPSVRGQSRLEAYPSLKHSGRAYDPDQEETSWDLGKVWDLVGKYRVPRRVNGRGQVSMYNRPYSVGVAWATQIIWVGFDALEGAWTFQDEKGHEIRRKVAAELSREPIRTMEVSHRRNGIHAAKPAVER